MAYNAGQRLGNPHRKAAGVLVALGLALGGGGCSLSLHLASLQVDPETTGAITRPASPLDPVLNDEDWRRAQAALSLAVDPQGSGQSVNWDNPASRRKGSFAAAGNLVLVDNTVCRPFVATIAQVGSSAPEIRRAGQACRVGPGVWTLREVAPAATDVTAKTAPAGAAATRQSPPQPLPAPTSTMLEALDPEL